MYDSFLFILCVSLAATAVPIFGVMCASAVSFCFVYFLFHFFYFCCDCILPNWVLFDCGLNCLFFFSLFCCCVFVCYFFYVHLQFSAFFSGDFCQMEWQFYGSLPCWNELRIELDSFFTEILICNSDKCIKIQNKMSNSKKNLQNISTLSKMDGRRKETQDKKKLI